MDQSEFMLFVDKSFIDCKRLLEKKRKHREDLAECDRLDQFKRAANLMRVTNSSAVGCMMVKHTTQLYTMLNEEHFGQQVDMKQWRETIYDSINYHLLLLAALAEEKGE